MRTAICSVVLFSAPVLHCLDVGIEKARDWVYSGYRCHPTGATIPRKEGELFWNLSLSCPCSLLLPSLRIMISLSELWPAPHPFTISTVILFSIPPLDLLLERALGKSKLNQVVLWSNPLGSSLYLGNTLSEVQTSPSEFTPHFLFQGLPTGYQGHRTP